MLDIQVQSSLEGDRRESMEGDGTRRVAAAAVMVMMGCTAVLAGLLLACIKKKYIYIIALIIVTDK